MELALIEFRYGVAKRLASCVGEKGPRIVLDAGCAIGYGAAVLAPVFDFYIGVDVDQLAVRDASRAFRFDNVKKHVWRLFGGPCAEQVTDGKKDHGASAEEGFFLAKVGADDAEHPCLMAVCSNRTETVSAARRCIESSSVWVRANG